MPSFAVSIVVLSLLQGVLVALPARELRLPPALRGRAWALVPPASVAAVIFAIQGSAGTAHGLTWLALIAVPPLAAVALGSLVPGARPSGALVAVPLFLLAWLDRRSLVGEASGALLSALSCVTLGVLLAAVAPPRWLKVGIVAMAALDSALVLADLLQAPNDVLDRVRPAAGLPRLQRLGFGSALLGYGDVFIAATLGALLAAQPRRRLLACGLTIGLALAFDLLFLLVRELPATVPVALALVLGELAIRRRPLGGVRPIGQAQGP